MGGRSAVPEHPAQVRTPQLEPQSAGRQDFPWPRPGWGRGSHGADTLLGLAGGWRWSRVQEERRELPGVPQLARGEPGVEAETVQQTSKLTGHLNFLL